MPEEQNVEGDRWLDKVIEILNALGWTQGGDKKVDIFSPKMNEPYGIDAYFTYYDPYEASDIGVIIEAKSRQWQSVNPSLIRGTSSKMVEVLQEVPLSDEFENKLNFNKACKVNTGFILLWTNDFNYDHNKFIEYLQKTHIPKKRQSQRIFIASNEELLRFCSIVETSKELVRNSKNNGEQFRYYYPSLTGTANEPKRMKHLTLEYLYSKYIFGKMQIIESVGGIPVPKKITVVLYNDSIILPALKLMYNALLLFQLLDVHEVWVYFYESDVNHRSDIEEFDRYVTSEGKQVGFKFKQMKRIDRDVYLWEHQND
jgi:hypothetical protein